MSAPYQRHGPSAKRVGEAEVAKQWHVPLTLKGHAIPPRLESTSESPITVPTCCREHCEPRFTRSQFDR